MCPILLPPPDYCHRPGNAVTSHLSADFAGSAKLGDWVESRVDIQKIGRTLAFANVYLLVDDTRIVRASGVFAVSSRSSQNASCTER